MLELLYAAREETTGNESSINALRMAYCINSALLFKFIFSRMRARYVLIVLMLSDMARAISLDDLPEANARNTSSSRVDSDSCGCI